MGKLRAFTDALFSDGWPTFFAVGLVIALLGFELTMNLKNGKGWVSIAHLAVIGPLWLFLLGVTILAAWRRVTSRLRAQIGPARGDH